jgi:hypothetical protein
MKETRRYITSYSEFCNKFNINYFEIQSLKASLHEAAQHLYNCKCLISY